MGWIPDTGAVARLRHNTPRGAVTGVMTHAMRPARPSNRTRGARRAVRLGMGRHGPPVAATLSYELIPATIDRPRQRKPGSLRSDTTGSDAGTAVKPIPPVSKPAPSPTSVIRLISLKSPSAVDRHGRPPKNRYRRCSTSTEAAAL